MQTSDPHAPPPPLRPTRRWRFFRAVAALILREMETSYGRSPGGYIWAIIEPVGAITVLSVVFSLVLRSPGLGTNFPLFYASGYLIFQLYSQISGLIAGSIRYSRPLLAYPAVTFMDALTARLLLNALTQLLVMVIVFAGIVTVYDLTLIVDWGAIFTAVAMALALAVGVGTLNCFLFTRFPVWQSIWGIVNRSMFILSGVIFIPEMIPTQYRDYVMLNPVIHATSEMRRGIYATYDGAYVQTGYPFVCALVLAIFGLLFLLRNHKDIVLR